MKNLFETVKAWLTTFVLILCALYITVSYFEPQYFRTVDKMVVLEMGKGIGEKFELSQKIYKVVSIDPYDLQYIVYPEAETHVYNPEKECCKGTKYKRDIIEHLIKEYKKNERKDSITFFRSK